MMIKNFKSLLVLCLLMGSLCATVWAQPGPGCEDCLTEPFDFVCVDDDGEIIPFPNICFAECAGFSVDDIVECEEPSSPGNDCIECLDEPFEPVCVDDDGEIIPFPNACFAECEGYSPDDFVECGTFPGGPGGGFECEECLDEPFEPVCVEGVDGHLIPFPNACFAECEGYDPDDFVECDSICPGGGGNPGADCIECLDEPFEPVCVDDDGEIYTFPNACFAECEGYSPDDFVECDTFPGGPGGPGADCIECLNEPFEPVCVDDDGEIIPFPNACFAECEGYSPDDFVECDTFPGGPGGPGADCIECLDEPFEPVCVDDDGEIIPFPNACFAECAGYDQSNFVECDSAIICDPPVGVDCIECLDEPIEPVCIEDGGLILAFPNACFAECAGYDENDIVTCDSLISGGGGNGQFATVSTAELSAEVNTINLVQNPVSHTLRLNVQSGEENTINGIFTVVDLNGAARAKFKVSISEGNNTFEFDVQELPAGIYLLHLQTDTYRSSVKFVK